MATARAKTPKEPAKGKGLTPQQRLFADYVVEGKMKSDAYRLAYPANSMNPHALSTEAGKTAKLPHVADYIAEALTERRREVLLTRDDKRQILGSIAKDTRKPAHARILAVKTDNEMTGDNAPVRVQEEITLFTIFTGMAKTTGLPGANEIVVIEETQQPALPAGTVPLPPHPDDELVPAMERRKQA